MSDQFVSVTGTIWLACDACNTAHAVNIDTPTDIDALTIPEPTGWELSPEGDRCPECVAAHRQVAHARTATVTVTETLAALAAQDDTAALSTQPATRTGPQPPAAPQGAPSRPSKR